MPTIGALIFPGFEVLDLYGPISMYGMMRGEIDIRIVAETAGPIAASSGPKTAVDDVIAKRDAYDVLLVPGGPGARREVDNQVLLNWIKAASDRANLVTSVCTGSALLARAGVLDRRQATTNKAAFQWASSQSEKVDWQAQARWVEDGKYFTSSGVSAGIDMSLAVIARLYDQDKAAQVAKFAEYDWHWDPTWDPFAEIHGLV